MSALKRGTAPETGNCQEALQTRVRKNGVSGTKFLYKVKKSPQADCLHSFLAATESDAEPSK